MLIRFGEAVKGTLAPPDVLVKQRLWEVSVTSEKDNIKASFEKDHVNLSFEKDDISLS